MILSANMEAVEAEAVVQATRMNRRVKKARSPALRIFCVNRSSRNAFKIVARKFYP